MSYRCVTLTCMSTKQRVAEPGYVVEGWYWDKRRATAIASAREDARRKGLDADGDPQVHVVIVFGEADQDDPAA